MSAEQRQFARVKTSMQCVILDDGYEDAVACDISMGGAFVQTTVLPEIGAKLDMEFILPDSQDTIPVKAVVKRLERENRIGFGIAFVNISPVEQVLLEAYIRDLMVKQGIPFASVQNKPVLDMEKE